MKRLLLLSAVLLLPFMSIHHTAAAEDGSESIQSETVYHILVDRFNNGDSSLDEQIDLNEPTAYHGGDLQGIIDKLGHLKELGYTTLVLSPIMENSPDGYRGYWIEDFYKVEDQFGTMDDLRKLVKEAHNRDMKIVLEFVTNYVSDNHPMTSDSDKSDWLKKNNDPQSYRWQDETARFDQSNPEVQSFLTDVADYWIEKTDIDGYQFHAADEANQAFLDQLTTHIRQNNQDFYLLGNILNDESYTGNLTDNTPIQMTGNHALYESMSEVFANAGVSPEKIYETWQNTDEQRGLNYLDSPYTKRFTQKFQENGRNILTAWKLALTYLYTAPGTPLIYQGSEIPMSGTGFPKNQELVKWNTADKDLKEFADRIGALRSEFPALQYGSYELMDSSGAMSLFKRTYEDETIYVAINNDTESQAISIDDVASGKQLKGLLGDHLARENDNGRFRIGLARETAEVYVIQDDTGLNWIMIAPIVAVFVAFVAGIIYLSRQQKKREADA